jgi:uncharacterized membrane protein YfcA
MRGLLVLTLVGLVAQLVDGALGMAYGATSATLLLATGLAPVVTSASVHLAEVGTTLASGAAHARFRNVHWPTVLRLGVPGAVGAFLGAVVLSSLSTTAARPWMAGLLLVIGAVLLARFALGRQVTPPVDRLPLGAGPLGALGLVAGFVDATGGGGWGPVATPSLLLTGRMEPRRVIGTVDTSEFLVALAASTGFLVSLGSQVLNWAVVVGLLVGGVAAAPVAAWLVRKIAPPLLGASVGGLLVLTNVRTLFAQFGVTGVVSGIAYAVLFALWAGALLVAVNRLRREERPAVEVG